MNETRYDWLSDRWVIFAPNREERPDEYRRLDTISANEQVECPFCSGREHETPLPTLVLPENNFDETSTNRRSESDRTHRLAWQVRVVPNKFPAVPRHDTFSDLRVHNPFCSGGTQSTRSPTFQRWPFVATTLPIISCSECPRRIGHSPLQVKYGVSDPHRQVSSG